MCALLNALLAINVSARFQDFRRRAVESVRSAELHLFTLLCDDVEEVDDDMRIIELGKLGLMLYQSSHRDRP